MDKEVTPKPNLPVLKCRDEDFEYILKFFAVSDTLDEALESPNFVKRLEAIPHAMTGVRMMSGRMLQMVTDLTATMPENKRRSLFRMKSGMRYRVYCRIPAHKVECSDTVLSNEELGVILKYANIGNCDICFEQNCNRCKLGKVFDNIMMYDREKHETWATWEGWANMP
jgi:hypothetical protein